LSDLLIEDPLMAKSGCAGCYDTEWSKKIGTRGYKPESTL